MEWSMTYLWLILALALGVAELTTGSLVLLALAIAAGLTGLTAGLGASVVWQLVAMGLLSGLLVPIMVWKVRPWFSPRGVAYGTTGTGVEHGQVYSTLRRDFDDASGIKINGDFYRLRVEDTGETELPEDTSVVFQHFDGTTAVVTRQSTAPTQGTHRDKEH
jgi:membrane protein implicated in regulation of membrane protease activity